MIENLENLPEGEWKKIRVPTSKGKNRQIKVHDSNTCIKAYGENKAIRQIVIIGHGRIKPALIISNDFDIDVRNIVKKYAKRWLVEKTISEQSHFFSFKSLIVFYGNKS